MDPRGPASHPSGLEATGRWTRRRKRWVVLAGTLGGVALLSVLLGFGLSRDPTLIRSPLLGRPAPDFSLRALDGTDSIRLSDLREQVVVINFWASWCAECRVEHPVLAATWDRYREQGVVVLGIAFQDRPSASRAYLSELGGGWPQLSDPGERTALAYGVYGVPETFVVAPDGRVMFKQVGAVNYGALTDEIERLVATT